MYNLEDYVIHTKRESDGHYSNQVVFKFPNGYGASLIQGKYSYGGNDNLFEIAVLTFPSESGWEICYDTEITDFDVLGYLTEDQVYDTLNKIYKLRERIDETRQSRIEQNPDNT